ncbi:acyl-CoA thioesterase [Jannaschia sp. R86511]|uniref:acyl-CoA thioesterase n=1 Tax=Jannaschia sp. R86511 TaxID=3093853 RepID=UPI0036D215A7
MNLYLRLLHLLFVGGRRTRVTALGPVRTPFRVWPSDLDLLRHVNNGVYLTIMDVARLDLLARAGVAPLLKAEGWYPVVVAETITFKRSLKLFERFDVRTQVIGWDERALFLQQDFLRGDGLVASAVVRARFLGRDGSKVTSRQVLDLAGHDPAGHDPAPLTMPRWVTEWAEATEIRSAEAVPYVDGTESTSPQPAPLG